VVFCGGRDRCHLACWPIDAHCLFKATIHTCLLLLTDSLDSCCVRVSTIVAARCSTAQLPHRRSLAIPAQLAMCFWDEMTGSSVGLMLAWQEARGKSSVQPAYILGLRAVRSLTMLKLTNLHMKQLPQA
jgi:hypothetical protein